LFPHLPLTVYSYAMRYPAATAFRSRPVPMATIGTGVRPQNHHIGVDIAERLGKGRIRRMARERKVALVRRG
jgi:hypothetical protein